jgi:hypothetical protein
VSDSFQGAGAADLLARDREVAHLAFNFVLDMAVDAIPGLKPLECLLLMAVNQANIAPLTRDPQARSRYGALEHPAPDEERRPVSVRAVAASMQLPYETARRKIRRLETQGVCLVSDAGVVVPRAFMASPAYLAAARLGHERLHVLCRRLRARQLLDPPPPPHYDEREPPIRGAVRIMSDYLLRASDAVVARTGDLVTTIVILPLLAAAAATDPEARPAPLSVAAIARRTQLPAETVRRHAAALVADGICESGLRGLTLVDHALVSPPWSSLLRENSVAVQRMFAGLAERGVIAVWDQMAAGDAGPAPGGLRSGGA